ncbi:hypothetical protein [Spiroplasma citri]|uniref:hypothetical protein n=1 Tax=Spiroplasma citri TaxID=2133 RepID=UPI00148B0CBD|nr:hypothetical protein [Spiroplasma citri]QJU61738.1 hypothetical protein HHA36_04745 [Spiroplasma citri]
MLKKVNFDNQLMIGKQSAYNDNLIYNAILKTSLWMDRLSGGTISDKINKKDLFPWVKKDNTGVI